MVHLLGFNKNTVQRIFQLMGWQVRKRPVGFWRRVQAMPSVATAPNERWSTDMCRVWAGRDGWATLALVIDCHTRELLGWHLSRSGKATTASSALEHALIARFGTLGNRCRLSKVQVQNKQKQRHREDGAACADHRQDDADHSA
ncbi:DDE-type integrase/transposase/recombinase [Ralstonia sp. UBA689]|uniref:DDE-type integrase/transposase/recombinase n=1 Tax=Ralstonia sp. UBA689 TaxID=1947373 RepID=UPI0025E9A1C0|nr:DDE-type integrase/transposase/recombinase [Ralstonia sp. UBA689]